MKRIYFILIVFAAALYARAQSPVYIVSGRMENAEGSQLFLQKVSGGKMVIIDTATISKGKFAFKSGSVEYPQMVYLTTSDLKRRLSFFIENSKITITGSLETLASSKVTGSKSQDELNSLSEGMKELNNRYSEKNNAYQSALRTGNNTRAEALSKEMKEISDDAMQIQKDFVKNHPSSFVVPMILQSISSSLSASEIESIINSLDPAVASTPEIVYQKSRLEILKLVETGQKAPDFIMNNQQGKPVSLYSLTGKNILLIDFWAAWCGPCRKENPNIVKVYNEFKDKGFDILGVSLDRTAADWNKAVTDDKLTWTHVSDLKYWDNAAARMYGVNSIPANFLLDKNGIIIARNLRGQDLYNKVSELLGNK